jgi:peptidoglycan/xylan/chitin deacetylase (PgdA/CDA1 family)
MLKILFLVSFLIIVLLNCLIANGVGMISFLNQNAYGSGHITLQPIGNGYNSTKVIILAFDDSPKSQFTLAKPILDKYGFKGSFFTVCMFVNAGTDGQDKTRMTWKDIKTLQEQEHDIESHTMTHTNLDAKSDQNLTYEIGGSKQCLLNHGIDSTIFAYPASTGHSNATVVNVVSKYYDLARTGDAPLAFMHCNGYKKEKNCAPFDKKGEIIYLRHIVLFFLYNESNFSFLDCSIRLSRRSNADPYNGNKIIITYVTSRAATIMKVRENIHQQIGRRWSLPLTYLSKDTY